MPYPRSRYRTRRPTYRRRSTYPTKTIKRIANTEIKRVQRTTHPLQWVDILFDGGNVNTTPTVHSLVDKVRLKEISLGAHRQWSSHTQNEAVIYQGKYQISYVHYQLRFQQDVENIESSNTFRTIMYSYVHTMEEDPNALFNGTDIDSPPQTEYVKSMYWDRMRTLRAGSYDPYNAEETDPTPGTAIIKGSKRLNSTFTFITNSSGTPNSTDAGDIRWEAQSDSIGNGLQLYGFMRIYYRRLQ